MHSLQLLNEVALSDRNLLFHSSGNEKSERSCLWVILSLKTLTEFFLAFFLLLVSFWQFLCITQSVSIISQPVSIFSILIITLVLLDYSLLSNNLILIWLHLQRCCVQLGHIHRCQEVRASKYLLGEHILTQSILLPNIYIFQVYLPHHLKELSCLKIINSLYIE